MAMAAAAAETDSALFRSQSELDLRDLSSEKSLQLALSSALERIQALTAEREVNGNELRGVERRRDYYRSLAEKQQEDIRLLVIIYECLFCATRT